MKSIKDLTAAEFGNALHMEIVESARTEKYVLTHIGSIRYAVNIDSGASYTRPQLIERFEMLGGTAAYSITRHK